MFVYKFEGKYSISLAANTLGDYSINISLQIIEEVSSHHPVTFTDAEQEYNSSKNRFPDKLPSECYTILLPAL